MESFNDIETPVDDNIEGLQSPETLDSLERDIGDLHTKNQLLENVLATKDLLKAMNNPELTQQYDEGVFGPKPFHLNKN